jgi:hypothetical protein
MNCLVVDNLTVESPVVIVICNSESYWIRGFGGQVVSALAFHL